MATMITPTTRGSVPGLMEARVWPPRITHVVEKPSLQSHRDWITSDRRVPQIKQEQEKPSHPETEYETHVRIVFRTYGQKQRGRTG